MFKRVLNNKIEKSGNNSAVDVESVTKVYRIHYGKNPSLKDTILRRKRVVYEEFLALDDVSFQIKHGEAFGIIGPNGSGKSTLLKLMAKILQPTSGQVKVNGKVSALLELGAGFHPDLTGRENIYINAAILGIKKKEVARKFNDIVGFSELEKFIDMPVKNYSSGMYMRLGFSIAINVDPDILLVDEVLAVGDRAFQAKCYKVIYSFIKRGKTIIIVSHDLDTISDVCSRVIFLNNGKIESMGDPTSVVGKYRAYAEQLERNRALEKQKSERKKIFETYIEGKKKIISGEEIDRLSSAGIDGEAMNRFGSGDAEIKSIEVFSRNDKKIDLCKYGDEVKIVFNVIFNTDVEEPIFGIRITDHKYNIVYGTNNRLNDVKTGVYSKGDAVKVIFEQKINLIGGEYYISPSVGYKDGRSYCDWINNMLVVNVAHHSRAEGVADLNSDVIIKKV